MLLMYLHITSMYAVNPVQLQDNQYNQKMNKREVNTTKRCGSKLENGSTRTC
jgi:hypothetical protein